jgi:hypothetical protein
VKWLLHAPRGRAAIVYDCALAVDGALLVAAGVTGETRLVLYVVVAGHEAGRSKRPLA